MKRISIISALILAGLSTACASAHQEHTGGIKAEQQSNVLAPFDIIHTKISTEGNTAIFHIAVSEKAGSSKPTQIGKLAGSEAFAYVWPTNIDSYEVGFEHKAGILALAVATHPDFDDTPLFDENRDGKTDNDGNIWHSHWVVLQPNEMCGKGALGVVDIPEGSKPRLPKTWPGLPILLDSPGWQPTINDKTVEVRVPFDDIGIVNKAQFDGVTAGLRINVDVHAPLFCVVDVFDIASGDLSLPGKVNL
ncbi:hypothetical protein HWQ46_20415 [Shewanella sp. D64]|uniref:hypothetical protein n=1 Tax=unclassified Shewanella TaxID=196818 RepID=UPI0022BA3D50|nr:MULTISPECIES: hypothetical protein [unclassified Shewanella]MEC4727902.1 hypothetical protein [Shewanella sp. D64]MEC4739944.1 hypothetical protein [Shewanella sp. E94]WBJ97094.1 hypothetical protein HWQ47_08295 [Shewanella sp. MTB7]